MCVRVYACVQVRVGWFFVCLCPGQGWAVLVRVRLRLCRGWLVFVCMLVSGSGLAGTCVCMLVFVFVSGSGLDGSLLLTSMSLIDGIVLKLIVKGIFCVSSFVSFSFSFMFSLSLCASVCVA